MPAATIFHAMANLNRLQFILEKNPQGLVLFTSVDGTLLDDETYTMEAAGSALDLLAARDMPLIFCSSKTFAEQAHLQMRLGIRAPFVFENGSAVAIPQAYFPDGSYNPNGFSGDYDIVLFSNTDTFRVRSVVTRLNRIYGLQLRGFSDCALPELNSLTRLAGQALERARDRMFTEILVNPPDQIDVVALNRQLAQAGLTLGRNARFNSIQAIGIDKGVAVRWLKQLYTNALKFEPVFAGIGDSANDTSMFTAVDIKFLVQRPGRIWAPMSVKGLNYIREVGPAGFYQAVQLLV